MNPLLLLKLKSLWPLFAKNSLPLVMAGLLVFQYIQIRDLRSDLAQSNQRNEQFKEALAKANQTIVRLDEAAKHLPVGETRTIFVDVPKFIGYEKPVPVFITRTEKTVETKIETIALPPEKIKEIIEKSVQSIQATMTALRDIKAGEKFTVTFAQVAPGIWQPIVTADSPVGVDARVITPIDKIPQPVAAPAEPRKFSLVGYSGISSMDALVAGIRPSYQFSRTFGLEGQAECRGVRVTPSLACTRGTDFRIVGTVTW